MLLADGFEKAFIGTGRHCGLEIAVYDSQKCIEILCEDMSEEDAIEYFNFNVVGSYVGKYTPLFLERKNIDDV